MYALIFGIGLLFSVCAATILFMASKRSVNLAADLIADISLLYEEHFKSMAYLALECAERSQEPEYWRQRIRGVADSLNFEIRNLNEDFEKKIEKVGQ